MNAIRYFRLTEETEEYFNKLFYTDEFDTVIVADKQSHTNKFNHLLSELQPTDTIYTNNFGTICKNKNQLNKLFTALDESGANIVLMDYNIDSSIDKQMFLNMYKAINQFSTQTKSVAVKAGMRKVAEEGGMIGRAELPDSKIKQALEIYHSKTMSVRELCKYVGISQGTLYKYLRQEQELQ